MSTFLDTWKATTAQIEGAVGQALFALDRLADVVGEIDPDRAPHCMDDVREILAMCARVEEIGARLRA